MTQYIISPDASDEDFEAYERIESFVKDGGYEEFILARTKGDRLYMMGSAREITAMQMIIELINLFRLDAPTIASLGAIALLKRLEEKEEE